MKNVFDDDDDEAPEVYIDPKKRMVMQSIQKAREEQQTAPIRNDYDDFYDTLKVKKQQAAKIAKEKEEKERGQSKYISSLLKTAEERKFVQEQVVEKKILSNLEKEKEIYGETEVFYTQDYKAKLAENQKKIEQFEKKNLIIEKSKSGAVTALKTVVKDDLVDIGSSVPIPVAKEQTKDPSVSVQTKDTNPDVPPIQVESTPLWPKPTRDFIMAAKERALQRLEARMK
jgi:hypothetical protein